MKFNIVCAGTGGQGVLTAALILARAAMNLGYHIRQSEVHGIAQRGGSVSAQLRIADTPIESDLIPRGGVNLIIGMEPLEGLRFVPWLAPEGTLLSSLDEARTFPDYPDPALLHDIFKRIPGCISVQAKEEAQRAGAPQAANMLLLGIALRLIPILSNADIEKVIRETFKKKGEHTIAANLKAFDAGKTWQADMQAATFNR